MFQSRIHYAHSHPDQVAPGDKWQRLADHLRAVARTASEFGQQTQPAHSRFAEAGEACGLLHDLGKYTAEFQDRLEGKVKKRVVHALQGANFAATRGAMDVALAIAGHHAGLPSLRQLLDAVKNYPADDVLPAALPDLPELADLSLPPLSQDLKVDRLRADLAVRMLFSCLVDADFLDTEQHFDPSRSAQRSAPALDPQRHLATLLEAIRQVAGQVADGPVKRAREHVLGACLRAGELPAGFFSLTVPTGGGKTLSSMAFALQHAAAHGLQRIIYVLPYLNIIEQNARVLRKVFAGQFVLEHHSLADFDGTSAQRGGEVDDGFEAQTPSHRLAAENWDAPLVVTTNVQFFESLFANRSSACRKLHRIARSVVILDECQTLPPGLLSPILSMLKMLVADFGASVVFCTATQPAFHARPQFDAGIASDQLREIVPDHQMLFTTLKRTHVIWPTKEKPCQSWQEIGERMRRERQVLCIVNLRRHARELYGIVAEKPDEEVFHLSTNLCPAHRLKILGRIRQRLVANEPCRVVATQLVEAGVDIDFPCVLRALGPFDSIAQAAGRCNREGRLTGSHGEPLPGTVEVFVPEDDRVPSGVYRLATDKTRALLQWAQSQGNEGPDIHDPAAYDDYFRRLYADTSLDESDLQTSPDSPRQSLDFPAVAAGFRLIPNVGTPVIVQYNERARKLIHQLCATIRRHGVVPRPILRRLQRYQVQRWPHEFRADQQQNRVESLTENVWLWHGRYDLALGIVDEELPTADDLDWIV